MSKALTIITNKLKTEGHNDVNNKLKTQLTNSQEDRSFLALKMERFLQRKKITILTLPTL